MNLGELATRLGCQLRGNGDVEIVRVAGIEDAGPGDLTFLANPRYASRLTATRASAVILSPGMESPVPTILSDNPYLTFAHAVALLHPQPAPVAGVHPSAHVDPSARLGSGVHVGAMAVIGPRVRIGDRTVIHPHVVLYSEVEIGDDCIVHSGVQIREGCRLGHRVIIQNGAVIGADGFGFAKDGEGRYHKISQVGIVVIEDDVEIGALSAIDRAVLRETRIGRGTKIDNLVQVGHSVTVGSDTILCGQVGIAGSTRIGNRVTLAGQVGVIGHISVGEGVIVTAQSGIAGSVESGAVISGSPAFDNRGWLKVSAALPRLPELLKRLREVERRLRALPQETEPGKH